MNPPCTLCGSVYWPIKDDPCPLCRAPDDEVDDDRDHDSHDDERYDEKP